jgi:hypothetical protein
MKTEEHLEGQKQFLNRIIQLKDLLRKGNFEGEFRDIPYVSCLKYVLGDYFSLK